MRTGKFLSLLKRFRSDERGAFLVIFGIMAIVLVATAGAAVDFTSIEQARGRAQDALDSAALGLQPTIFKSGVTEATIKASAQALVEERLDDAGISATVEDAEIDTTEGMLRLTASITVPMSFVSLVGVETITAHLVAQAISGTSANLEVALVLDITGSMDGSRISSLKTATKDLIDTIVQDVQTPTYSKVALIPYSQAVNVGSNAATVRGAVTAAKTITGATWVNGSTLSISAINKAYPAQITTSSSHGYSTGDTVYLSGISGGGFSDLNNQRYTITRVNSTRFTLNGVNTSYYWGSFSSGSSRRCFDSDCAVRITSSSHGFANGDNVVITGVNGMTQINNSGESVHTVSGASSNTFLLSGTNGYNYSNYTSGGSIDCTTPGCKYYYFTSDWWGYKRLFTITNCATERIGAQAYTDASFSGAKAGRNYRADSCIPSQVTPLSTNKSALKTLVDGYTATGSTAGHIGLAWGWYMLSPNIGYPFSAASTPAAYTAEDLLKVVVLMTDGDFNTAYCNGVVSKDAGSGSGSGYEHIDCNATNGTSLTQAAAMCTAIKNTGIIIYTVGFEISGDTETMMRNCATASSYYFPVSSGAQLQAAFAQIGGSISKLRLAE